jgi:predicted DNA-binding transcriptional regulator YafY
MSQIANCLRMLFFIKNRHCSKISEIANELGVNERSVRRYKEDLEQAGFYIGSQKGKYGGYFIKDDIDLFNGVLSEGEFYALTLVEEYLKKTNHVAKDDFRAFFEKIKAKRKNCLWDESHHMAKELTLPKNQDVTKKYLLMIREAIIGNKKLQILYQSLKSEKLTRIIHPYMTYQHQGDLYVIGFCETRNDFRDFKLTRIQTMQILKESFNRKKINLGTIMENTIGIIRGEAIHVILEIQHPMSQIIMEKQWVQNQKITPLENGEILFEAKMEGLPEIKSWILSMGGKVRVLGNEKLKDEIKKEIDAMKNFY